MAAANTRGTLQYPNAPYQLATLLLPNGVGVRFLGQKISLSGSILAEVLEITDGPLAGVLVAIENPFVV
jgi:hypothetical protein